MYHDTDREERSSMIEMMEAEYDSLGEMTEAEYGVLGEAAEAEYGICDLLDENIPSPLETDGRERKYLTRSDFCGKCRPFILKMER